MVDPWEAKMAVDVAVAESKHRQSTDALAVGRNVALEQQITKFDFITFRSEMMGRDFAEPAIKDAWDELRDEGVIEGDDADAPNSAGDDDDEADDAADEHVTTVEEAAGETGGGDTMIQTDDGLLAQFPDWAMEPWEVAIEPMGAGDEFAHQRPCDEGHDEVVYHFANPDEVETLQDAGEVTAANTWDGGMFTTEWARRPDGTTFNALAGADGDFDEGFLIGQVVCVDDDGQPLADQWSQINDNRWEKEGGYRTADTVAYQVSKAHQVPDDVPMVDEVITPLADLGIEGDSQQPTARETPDVPDDVGELSGEWDHGDTVALTQPGCEACEAFTAEEEVAEALETGALVEVQPDHDDWNVILEQTGVGHTPSVVAYDADAGHFRELEGNEGVDEGAAEPNL